jgi:hypothetical protein
MQKVWYSIFLNANSRVVEAFGSEFETNWLVLGILAQNILLLMENPAWDQH